MILKANLLKIVDRIQILYKGEEIQRSQFLDAYSEFMASCCQKDSMRCLILHPGTEIFTIIGMIIFVLSNLCEETLNEEEIIQTLNEGDKVVISGKKEQLAIFKGMQFVESSNKNMAVFEMKDGMRQFLPPTSYYKVTPYYGNAQTLGGRGIGTNLSVKKRFYSLVLSEDEERINPMIFHSLVIVCEKLLADSFMNNVEIAYENEKPVRIYDLFAGAYYTQNEMIYYAGNSYRFEPVLKFTSRMSVARELIIEDKEKDITGLFVCSEIYLKKSISELTNLLERKSLLRVCMLSDIIRLPGNELLNRYPELKLFASTPQALKCFDMKAPVIRNGINARLNQSIKEIIAPQMNSVVCTCPFDEIKYMKLKQNLFALSRFEDERLGEFVVTTYSLLKLLTLSIFPISHLDKISTKQRWDYINPSQKLGFINEYCKNYEGIKQIEVQQIDELITELFNTMYYENSKFQYVFDAITSVSFEKKILLIVPKAYYREAFYYSFQGRNQRYLKNIDIITVGNIRKEELADRTVILCGAFGGNESLLLESMRAHDLKVMLYDFEKPLLTRINQKIESFYSFYDSRNILSYMDTKNRKQKDIEAVIKDIDDILDEFLQKSEIFTMTSFVAQFPTGTQSSMTEVNKIIYFASGETAFLTRYFEAYVLNRKSGQIEEMSVSELMEGDELIFAKRDSQSKDMVDVLLERLVLDERCPKDFIRTFQISKHWKNALKKYMLKRKITYRDLADKMKQFGKGKHEATLRTWLNEESHIVGPRDEESFYEIALLTEDKEMLESPELFRDACNEVRSMRIRILKYIGKYIFGKTRFQSKDMDLLLKEIIGDISDVVQIYQIVGIIDGKDAEGKDLFVPSYFTNRPQVRS